MLPVSIMLMTIYTVLPYLKAGIPFVSSLNSTTLWWGISFLILMMFFLSRHYFFDTRNEDNLTETLTQAHQETFGKYKDCVSELNEANEVASFAIDFKLGMRLAVESMISLEDITEPKFE